MDTRIGSARGELRPSDACELAILCGKDVLYSAGRRACLCRLLACFMDFPRRPRSTSSPSPASFLHSRCVVSVRGGRAGPNPVRAWTHGLAASTPLTLAPRCPRDTVLESRGASPLSKSHKNSTFSSSVPRFTDGKREAPKTQ